MFFALAIAITAMADSYFYIDDIEIDGAYGQDQQVVIPVKATFGAYVNAFQVDITYPEGLTPVKV